VEIFKSFNDIPACSFPVVTIGMFDGVHYGHQQIIKKVVSEAKLRNGKSIVITFDTHPRMVLRHDAYKLKFINSFDEKISLLENHGVDYLILMPFTKEFSQKTASDFVKEYLVDALKVKLLVIGYDNRFGNKENNNFNSLFLLGEEYNFEIIKVDVQQIDGLIVSSTKIREALDKGNVKLANRLLGYKYSLYGKVIKGNKIGRKIGFPTANIDIENDFKLIPAIGVYAVLVIFNNKTYKGMLNIGIRPTLNINKLSIEVNIFDFDEVIYNKYLTVIFKDRIRDEIRFKNLEELIIQLKNDKINAEKILN